MKKILFILCAVLSLTTSCSKKNKEISFLPVSSGRPYEMLVVIEKDMYERPAGRALHDVLVSDVPGLPQHEANFRITTTPRSGFDRTYKIFRNIIYVDVDPKRYTQTRFKFVRDLNASPQMIMTIQAPDENNLAEYITEHGQTIVDFFNKAELNRFIKLAERSHSDIVNQTAKEMFGCEIWLPKDLTAVKKGKNFFWASAPTDNLMNFCMYSLPYTHSDIFTPNYFSALRDSVMEKNIPGEKEGMHMATQKYHGEYLVESQHIVVRHTFAQEVRGLWEMTEDNMGGPFVAHARVDTVNNRLIVVEGFVYMPNEPKKRNTMRRLEASLYTLQLPSEKPEELALEGVEEDNADVNSNLRNGAKSDKK